MLPLGGIDREHLVDPPKQNPTSGQASEVEYNFVPDRVREYPITSPPENQTSSTRR